MRISTDRTDAGYANWCMALGKTVAVYLNGEQQADVITADEEQGSVVQVLRDDDKVMYDGDDVRLVTLSGKVRIVVREP